MPRRSVAETYEHLHHAGRVLLAGPAFLTQTELRQVENEVDRAAAALWEPSEEELTEIRRSLEELRK